MSKKIFRAVLIIASISYAALLAIPFFDHLLTIQEQDILSWVGFGAILRVPNAFLWVYPALWFLAVIGLFFFYQWARVLFVAWICFTTVLLAFGGLDVRTALEACLLNISTILDGFILAVIFFSDLQQEFRIKNQESRIKRIKGSD